jgi:hypothetical protein
LAIAFTALEAFILFLWSFHCFHVRCVFLPSSSSSSPSSKPLW